MVRVLLVAPVPALRAGLRSLLSDSDVEIAGEATRLDSLDLTRVEADVLIYASASASSSDVLTDTGSAPLLILSNDPINFTRIIRDGKRIWGILPLETSREELLAAVHALAEGLIVGSMPLMKKLLNPTDDDSPLSEIISPLSDREIEVLNLLSQGLANKQIALRLGISDHTVKFHVSSIYNKLNVTNRAEAIRQGVRSGLISL